MSSASAPALSSARSRKGRAIACSVLLLDDTVDIFNVPVKSVGQVLFNEVIQKLGLLESDYFDLEYTDVHGAHCWLDREKPILKQLSRRKLDLRFVVKFYTPDPCMLEDEVTRYLFALQVKRDLSTGALPCHDHTAILLASYIVQSECGDYVEADFGYGAGYLKSMKLLPCQTDEVEMKIMGHHREHFGQCPADADLTLLDIARKIEHYGLRLYPAKDHDGATLHLSVTHMGIAVFQNLVRINTFSWAKIRKLSFKRRRFLIKLHPEGYGFHKDTVEFYFESRDMCKNFWKVCLEHHAFFRCQSVKRLPRRNGALVSRGSSFRYCGRTQKQLSEYVRENCVKRPPFQRSTSSRTMSVGASPRTGTLNSRDVQHSQLANMSSGSQVISASPPPVPLSSLAFSSHQPSHAAVRPVCSSPPRHQSASSSSPCQLSPRELSPLSLSLMSSSLVSPTVTVSASDMHGHHTPSPAAFTGSTEKYPFEVTRDRNVSTPAFPVTDQPGCMQQQQQLPGDRQLARTTEVENIPQQLSVRQPPDMLAYQSGVSLQHSQSASPPDIRDYNQNLGLSVDGGRQLQAAKIPEHLPADHTRYPHVTQIPQPQVPQPPAAYDGAVPARSRARNQRASETSSASRSPVDERRVIDDRPTDGGVSVRVSDVDRQMPLAPNISTHFTSDISLASSNVTTYEDNGRQKPKQFSQVYYICKEMLMTERTYKKDLDIINIWFRGAVCHNDVMSDSLMDLLFGCVSPLCDFHSAFLKQLEQRLASWEKTSGIVVGTESWKIGDVLLCLRSVLPRYEQYLAHEQQMLIALDSECQESRTFERIYREFEAQKVCYLPVNAFLLKPEQRLLHYQLIINKLLKFYGPHHKDYADCYEALEALKELRCAANEQMKCSEMLQKLIELQQDLVGIDSLLQPGREFIREGCLQKLSSKGYQQRMFFLFSDILVYASRTPTRSLQFKVHGQLPVAGMAIKETDSKMAAANSFSVYAGNRLLVVAASSEMEKSKWMEDLQTVIEHPSNRLETDQLRYGSLKSNCSSEVSDDSDAEDADRQIQHRTNTLMHVCWHRNTSVSMVERSIAVRNLLSGYLLRKFKSGSGWQKLWVVFTNFCLFFYKSHQDDHPLASLPLLGYTVQLPTPADGIQKDFVFKLQFKNHVYLFRAESQFTFDRWMEVMTLATSKSRHLRLFSRMDSTTPDT